MKVQIEWHLRINSEFFPLWMTISSKTTVNPGVLTKQNAYNQAGNTCDVGASSSTWVGDEKDSPTLGSIPSPNITSWPPCCTNRNSCHVQVTACIEDIHLAAIAMCTSIQNQQLWKHSICNAAPARCMWPPTTVWRWQWRVLARLESCPKGLLSDTVLKSYELLCLLCYVHLPQLHLVLEINNPWLRKYSTFGSAI